MVYLSIGLLGLSPAALTPPPADAPPTNFTLLYGYLLGLFPVNLLHTVAHLVIGVWGIVAWRGMVSPKVYARSLAIFCGVLAAIGLIPGMGTLFGILPIHGHVVWLYGATAAVAAYFWRSVVDVERRTKADRREQVLPVPTDRRTSFTDSAERPDRRQLPGV